MAPLSYVLPLEMNCGALVMKMLKAGDIKTRLDATEFFLQLMAQSLLSFLRKQEPLEL